MFNYINILRSSCVFQGPLKSLQSNKCTLCLFLNFISVAPPFSSYSPGSMKRSHIFRPSLRSCLPQAAETQFTRERSNVLTAKATGHFSVLIPPNLKFYLLAPTWTTYRETKAIHSLSSNWFPHPLRKAFILLHSKITRAVLYFCECVLSFKNKIKQNYSLISTFTFSFRKWLCLPPSYHSFSKYLLSSTCW